MNLKFTKVSATKIFNSGNGNAFSRFFHRKLSPEQIEGKKARKLEIRKEKEIKRQLKILPVSQHQRYIAYINPVRHEVNIGILEELTKIIKLMKPEFLTRFVDRFAKIAAKAHRIRLEDLVNFRAKLAQSREKIDSPYLLKPLLISLGYTQEKKRTDSIVKAIGTAEKKMGNPLYTRLIATVDNENGRYKIAIDAMPVNLESELFAQCLMRLNDRN